MAKLPKFPKGLKTRVNKLRKKAERREVIEARKKEIADLKAEEKKLKAKLSKPAKKSKS